MPVQAFLACAGDVIARIGILQLQAVQILLPVHSLAAFSGASSRQGAAGTLAQTAGWFTDRNPLARTQVQVTLDGGQNPAMNSAAPEVFKWTQEFKQDVFLCDSFSLSHDDALELKPTIIDELWLGPAHHRAMFRGTLVEWSLDALGWSAAFLAEACHRHGIRTPLLLTAGRSEESDD